MTRLSTNKEGLKGAVSMVVVIYFGAVGLVDLSCPSGSLIFLSVVGL